MKRILSLVLVCVLLVGTVFALASCGKTLSGKYVDALGATAYEFSGNKVTMYLGQKVVAEGTYKIEAKDDKETITFTFTSGDDAEDESGTVDFVSGKEGDDEYIKLGSGIFAAKYTKSK